MAKPPTEAAAAPAVPWAADVEQEGAHGSLSCPPACCRSVAAAAAAPDAGLASGLNSLTSFPLTFRIPARSCSQKVGQSRHPTHCRNRGLRLSRPCTWRIGRLELHLDASSMMSYWDHGLCSAHGPRAHPSCLNQISHCWCPRFGQIRMAYCRHCRYEFALSAFRRHTQSLFLAAITHQCSRSLASMTHQCSRSLASMTHQRSRSLAFLTHPCSRSLALLTHCYTGSLAFLSHCCSGSLASLNHCCSRRHVLLKGSSIPIDQDRLLLRWRLFLTQQLNSSCAGCGWAHNLLKHGDRSFEFLLCSDLRVVKSASVLCNVCKTLKLWQSLQDACGTKNNCTRLQQNLTFALAFGEVERPCRASWNRPRPSEGTGRTRCPTRATEWASIFPMFWPHFAKMAMYRLENYIPPTYIKQYVAYYLSVWIVQGLVSAGLGVESSTLRTNPQGLVPVSLEGSCQLASRVGTG